MVEVHVTEVCVVAETTGTVTRAEYERGAADNNNKIDHTEARADNAKGAQVIGSVHETTTGSSRAPATVANPGGTPCVLVTPLLRAEETWDTSEDT